MQGMRIVRFLGKTVSVVPGAPILYHSRRKTKPYQVKLCGHVSDSPLARHKAKEVSQGLSEYQNQQSP